MLIKIKNKNTRNNVLSLVLNARKNTLSFFVCVVMIVSFNEPILVLKHTNCVCNDNLRVLYIMNNLYTIAIFIFICCVYNEVNMDAIDVPEWKDSKYNKNQISQSIKT